MNRPCLGQQCSGLQTRYLQTDVEGVLTDGSGPNSNYTENKNCTWVLAANDPLATIVVESIEFETECGWDILFVRDGNATELAAHAPLLGAYSGTKAMPLLQSSGPYLTLFFHSDQFITAPGFRIHYKATRCRYACNFNGLCQAGTCQCDSGAGPYCLEPDTPATCASSLCTCSAEQGVDPEAFLLQFALAGDPIIGGVVHAFSKLDAGAVCDMSLYDEPGALPPRNISCPRCPTREAFWTLHFCPGLFDEDKPPATFQLLLPLLVAFFLVFVVILVAILLRSRHRFADPRFVLREGELRPMANIPVYYVMLADDGSTPCVPFPTVVPEACDDIKVPMFALVGPPAPGELVGRISLAQHVHQPHAPHYPPTEEAIRAHEQRMREAARLAAEEERRRALEAWEFRQRQAAARQANRARQHSSNGRSSANSSRRAGRSSGSRSRRPPNPDVVDLASDDIDLSPVAGQTRQRTVSIVTATATSASSSSSSTAASTSTSTSSSGVSSTSSVATGTSHLGQSVTSSMSPRPPQKRRK
ncbi:uncharacterized protein AMSG_06399 [Thecamonas trahens ATCC 50062]|uniref:CUB domain-containing protein n=1 Tax=Thecamonas trahens ATCC 50062 TaxID=461836 RepID=A0A0L0DD34_THETB|nr:hypothetical protein AMSG_06399 [Thecamonas trahens ATCC 50062]KNC50244.1 hypothetical protein AMSG_06399 [Thecamonas trahens ATCC 50062]|eukprot:XP_013757074.1 hypothetical protein AMSG_06399 [Thecamonas trahens ATCC 50062]